MKNIKDYVGKHKATILMLFTIILILCAFPIFCFFMKHNFSKLEESGQFGDQFGALNALFSALAFAGLIYTIFIQKKELELQRDELRLTREEMKSQSHEFVVQNTTMKLQRFENTFFNMLNLQNQIVSQLKLDLGEHSIYPTQCYKGGSIIDTRATTFEGQEVFYRIFNDDRLGCQNLKQIIEDEGLKGFKSSNILMRFEHYMLNTFTILKFIDDADDSVVANKREYANILRASLSSYELVLLFYYNLFHSSNYDLKGLVEKYTIFKYLDKRNLTLCKDIRQMYPQTKDKDIISYIEANNSCPTDYYFFINADKKCNSGYYVSAFYEDKEMGLKEVEAFQKLLSAYNK